MPTPEIALESALLAEQLRPVVLRLQRQLRRETQGHGVSALHVTLLAEILREPGVGVSSLAQRECMSTPSMSSHVKQLEADGLLTRTADLHDDRRRVGLFVTPQGKKLLENVRKLRTDWLASRLAGLPASARAALAAAVEPMASLSE